MTQYKASVLERVASINTDLKTDQDFMGATALVKFFKDAEVEVQVGKKIALAQTADIDELFRTVDELVSAVSKKRIELEKIIQLRKTQARDELKSKADSALAAHVAQVDATLGGVVVLPTIAADFAEAIKGKRNLDSMNNAITAELTGALAYAAAASSAARLALWRCSSATRSRSRRSRADCSCCCRRESINSTRSSSLLVTRYCRSENSAGYWPPISSMVNSACL
jgi:hypothetical protein